MNEDIIQRVTGQIEMTNEILQRHEEQLGQVRNVIMAALETKNLTETRARNVLIDIANILHIALYEWEGFSLWALPLRG